MARSRMSKFDASEVITNELIRVIERGVLPWRKPWIAGASTRPLRHTGEPYQGINNFLLTMRMQHAGYASPFWMTIRQVNALEAKVRKGEKSSVVVYYGQAKPRDREKESDAQAEETASSGFRFQKAYRVFNADQVEGLPESFHPAPAPAPDHPPHEPIPHMQDFFDAIDIVTSFTGREAYYMAAVDKVYMPDISLFEDPRSFYGVWAHELAHATKARHRLNRSYGDARFGNTAYAREEIVALS
ncbi:putative antirestriction protein [Litoreibacter arenae DSM 19593]|uniref:Putative antirestriction protein n=1 Tax=Litoreibacter arenae DSM 19593 TaxID=1123360 RepID=S9QG28_9RHOB|nr:putative antirestriction protein [Litoreibacter arenae DSM 19593]